MLCYNGEKTKRANTMPARKSTTGVKTAVISVRTTESHQKLITRKAKAINVTVSQYIEILVARDCNLTKLDVVTQKELANRLRVDPLDLGQAIRDINGHVNRNSGNDVTKDLDLVRRLEFLAEGLSQLDPDKFKWYPMEVDGKMLWSTTPVVQTVFPVRSGSRHYLDALANPFEVEAEDEIVYLPLPAKEVEPLPPLPTRVRPRPQKSDRANTGSDKITCGYDHFDSTESKRKLVKSSQQKPAPL